MDAKELLERLYRAACVQHDEYFRDKQMAEAAAIRDFIPVILEQKSLLSTPSSEGRDWPDAEGTWECGGDFYAAKKCDLIDGIKVRILGGVGWVTPFSKFAPQGKWSPVTPAPSAPAKREEETNA